jgi:hypothetical protein
MKGKFKARAKTGLWGLGATSSGNKEVAVLFDILDESAEYSSLTWRGYLSDAAFERTIESLRICGWEGDDLSKLEGLDKNEVELVVEEEEYEGKIQTKVRWVNRLGSLSIKAPLEGDQLKSFAAAMQSRIRALDASKGKKTNGASKPSSPPPSGPPEPPPLTDADIPF